MKTFNRRQFLQSTVVTGIGISMLDSIPSYAQSNKGKRVGIIGLDTSHSVEFTKILNAENQNSVYDGYRIVAAYPFGSKVIESSSKRIPGYTEQVQKLGVEIVDSIQSLLKKVDVVLLETNDGTLHKAQALEVLKSGKRMFIDKPIAASLADAYEIFDLSKKYKTPIFSASSLRYIKGIDQIDKSKVLGADAYSPAVLEPTHPDLFWYGVHGVETLYTAMGIGCKTVTRVHTKDSDLVVGVWEDGRTGTFRGMRKGKTGYGGVVFTEDGNKNLGPYAGYEPLLVEIIKFFNTGIVPVSPEETLEIFTFMEAADESKRQGGVSVTLDSVRRKINR